MAVIKNWTRYETTIGWQEVTGTEAFSGSILLKLLEECIVYENGKLYIKS